jgi:Tol biopolymer transport system component/tRNA A-37 threonylcarbamoyl transferase component Bud32
MSLTPGSRFGTFEVVAPLGAGAMGEVYRARDTKLNRTVALKVLPERVADDPERLARLKREAQTLASINHPGIAAIYGFEDSGNGHALVLELVEGQTLEKRIAQGAIPVEEALPLAGQIAAALEAAHEAGIVHRDLKPANITITPDGVVKLLDFGIAKAVDTASVIDATQSPTLSPTLSPTFSPTMAAGATAAGTLMGTATYMAPEQARGKAVDRRADIWAFGCVLYEMLAGRRAFDGDSMSDVIAAILRSEPDWTALPTSTPAAIRRLLRRCLDKERRDRLQAIGDARIEIREAITSGPEAPAHVGPALKAHGFPTIPVVAAAVVAALVAGGAAWVLKPVPASTAPLTRALLAMHPFDQRAVRATNEPQRRDRIALALSPDGRTLVVRARNENSDQLYIRHLDRLEMTAIPGTERADGPFFSSDGGWVAFRDGAEMKKVPIGGGVVSVITRIPGTVTRFVGGSWQGNVIVFATGAGLWQVDADGGEPKAISTPSAEENLHILPALLPGGRTVLHTVTTDPFRWDNARIVARDLAGGMAKVVLENAADPHYSSSGHLLFMRGGTLMAVPFDADALEVTGSPTALAQNVMQAVNTGNSATDSGAAQVAVAGSGTLVYATGGPAPQAPRALAWVDRSGMTTALAVPEREYSTPRISPDGRQFAVTIGPDRDRRVWVGDAQRGGLSPVTAAGEGGFWNIWSPDGAKLTYSSFSTRLSVRQADGSGQPELLYTAPVSVAPSSYANNGRLLAYVENSETGQDIWVQDLGDPARPRRPLVNSAAIENFPEFSPDGKWLAYASDGSGRAEVFVQPYPGPGPRVQISFNGGNAPAWNHDGTELYFNQAGAVSTMMAAGIRATQTGMTADTPRRLFEGRYSFTGPVRGYDVTPDGTRFLMVQARDLPPQPPIELVLVQNWTAALAGSPVAGSR